MDLSVVVCTYNRAPLLGRALTALQGQYTAPGLSWELVVVDNASVDRTKDIIEEAKAASSIPMVYVFEGRQGKGFALNTGVDAARGSVLAFTDDDCRPGSTWLQDLMDAFERWGADGVGGRILPEWSSPPPPWLAGDRHLWTSLALLEDDAVRRVELGPWQREHGFRVWGANMAFRREALGAVGGFTPTMGPRGTKKYSHEDIDLVRRMVEAGKAVVFDPAPTVLHWVGPERMRKGFFRRHSFYYGEGAAMRTGAPRGRHVLGVPPYLLRMLGGHAASWARAALRRDPETFCSEREIHEGVGYLSGYVKSAARTGDYARLRRRRAGA